MDLVLLPHHNTLTSIQKLQALMRSPDMSGFQKGNLFLPAYPPACRLAHVDDAPKNMESNPSDIFHTVTGNKTLKKQMAVLKDLMKDTDGPCLFLDLQIAKTDDVCTSGKPGENGEHIRWSESKLILPVKIPFLQTVRSAGFIPEETPHFILGTLFGKSAAEDASILLQACTRNAILPPPARIFRLALMQESPLLTSDGTDSLLSGTDGTYNIPQSAADVRTAADPAAGVSWKFIFPFWIKVR